MKLIETTLIEKVRSARHETFFFVEKHVMKPCTDNESSALLIC
jgi:hypothetical protein